MRRLGQLELVRGGLAPGLRHIAGGFGIIGGERYAFGQLAARGARGADGCSRTLAWRAIAQFLG